MEKATPLCDRVQQSVNEGTLPGAVLALARGGEVTIQALGSMAVNGPAMREDAIIRIQSMTKPILSVATLRLVQDGRLDLEDPVDRWLPQLAQRHVLVRPTAELHEVAPASRPITVRDLLTNASGYGMQLTDSPYSRAMVELGVAAGPEPISPGADEWLERLAKLPLAHQPGAGFRYHHSFCLLGILLQRVMDEPRQKFLRRTVFDPLGMVDTGATAPTAQSHRLPAAYAWREGSLVEIEPRGGGFYAGDPPYDLAHGELVSTAADYLRFARMLASGGQLNGRPYLDPALVRQMMSDQTPAVAKTPESFFPGFWGQNSWGWGGAVVTKGAHAGRFGWSGGLGTDFFIDPDGSIAILLFQVEMGEQTRSLLEDFTELAGS